MPRPPSDAAPESGGEVTAAAESPGADRADGDLGRAHLAGSWSFVLFGGVGASWAARIPQIRDRLRLDPSELGLVLLAVAIGAVVSLALSGGLVRRLGPPRTVRLMATTVAAGLGVMSLGHLTASVPTLVAGLFVLGFGTGAWDVAINVHAGAVEHRIGRSVLPRFHAWFSVGSVAGALAGTGALVLDVPVPVHLVASAAVILGPVVVVVRGFLPPEPPARTPATAATVRDSAWREPRTLLIGVAVLATTFAEGAGTDWAGVATVDGHHLAPGFGALALATVLTSTTLVRWFGPAVVDSRGRAWTLRTSALAGAAGVTLFVLAPRPGLAFAGLALWGAGLALGFPIGMSAATDDPARASQRVSVVAAVGYSGFVLGPIAIGFLGDRVGVLRALLVVAGMLAVSGALSSAVRDRAAT